MPRATTSKKTEMVCSECGRAFMRKFDLKRHIVLHSSNIDEMKLKCRFEDCTYSTLQRSNLTTHISAIHLKLKPHKCGIEGCTSAFADSASHIRHQRNIHGIFRKTRKSPLASTAKENGGPRLKIPEIVDLTIDDHKMSPVPSLSDGSSFRGSITSASPSPRLPSQQFSTLEEVNWATNNLTNYVPGMTHIFGGSNAIGFFNQFACYTTECPPAGDMPPVDLSSFQMQTLVPSFPASVTAYTPDSNTMTGDFFGLQLFSGLNGFDFYGNALNHGASEFDPLGCARMIGCEVGL